jgi:hypothetical protein
MNEERNIGEQYTDILAEFAKQSIDNSSAPTEQVIEQVVTPEVPLEPEPTAPVLEAPATPEVPAPAKEVPDALEVWSDWDATPEVATPTEPVVPTPQVQNEIFVELSKALGATITSKDDVIKLLEVEKQKTIPDNIPAELKKAVELASKGADYLEYLKVNTVDYSKADPVELYENYIIDSLSDEQGQVDEEKVNSYLDSLSDVQKELEGKRLQRQLIVEQQRRTVELEQSAIRAREKHDADLKAALRGFAEIDGFKVDDNHRRELFDWISSGGIMKDLFYGQDGSFDPIKAAKVAFRNKYYDKLDSYHKTKIRNATKREILKDITNQEIVTTPKNASPQPTKSFGIQDYIESLKQQNLTK